MENIDLRIRMIAAGIRQSDVARAIGVGEFTFSRWLRYELPPDKKARVMEVIDRLAGGM